MTAEPFMIDNGDDEGPRQAYWATDYDALAAELAEAKKRYSHEYSLVLEGICRKHEARVKELSARNASLEAALRKYGEHSAQCNRLGVINGDCYCGFAHVLDSLDEGSTAETEGDGPKCKRCNQYLCMCPIKPPIVSRNL